MWRGHAGMCFLGPHPSVSLIRRFIDYKLSCSWCLHEMCWSKLVFLLCFCDFRGHKTIRVLLLEFELYHEKAVSQNACFFIFCHCWFNSVFFFLEIQTLHNSHHASQMVVQEVRNWGEPTGKNSHNSNFNNNNNKIIIANTP